MRLKEGIFMEYAEEAWEQQNADAVHKDAQARTHNLRVGGGKSQDVGFAGTKSKRSKRTTINNAEDHGVADSVPPVVEELKHV